MIIAGYEYRGQKPFSDVYLHGLVRDKQRRKMSKSLGNSPDPLDLIAKYGADGVRVGMLLCSPAGNDLLYDDILPEQGRNYANKVWNAFRLVNGWEVDSEADQPEWSRSGVKWFANRLSEAINEYNRLFAEFRISEALMIVYRLFWDDFSSWYLEIIKPDYQKPIDSKTYSSTLEFFDQLMRLIHPFMPFITEEIWHLIDDRKEDESIMISSLPTAGKTDLSTLRGFEKTQQLVSAIRTVRKERDIPNRESIQLFLPDVKDAGIEMFMSVVRRLANIESVEKTDSKPDGTVSFLVGTNEYYIPVGDRMDIDSEIEKLEADLKYNMGFLVSVMKKLENDSFVKNAPEKVIETERRKKADAESNIEALKQSIAGLKKEKS
jgi:valyl-tRNA synthetase